MDYLAFNSDILCMLLVAVYRYILDVFILNSVGNIFSNVFDGIVVNILTFNWNVAHYFLFFIFNHFSLVGYVLKSRFTLDWG